MRALYDCEADADDEVSFQKGDLITEGLPADCPLHAVNEPLLSKAIHCIVIQCYRTKKRRAGTEVFSLKMATAACFQVCHFIVFITESMNFSQLIVLGSS